MKSVRPMKLLIITQLDIDKMYNTVEEQHARRYARAGCDVTFLFKVLNQSSRFIHLIRDSCSLRTHLRPDSELHCITVDPFFNYFAGYRENAEVQTAATGSRPSLRLLLIRLLSPLSVFRDLFFVPCFVLVALLSRRGPWDVCVGFGPWGGLTGWLLQRLHRTRLLVYQDRDFEPGLVPYRLRQTYTAAIERFCIKRADLVCSIGYFLAERRRRESGRTVHVIPNGVEWDKFAPARNCARSGYNLVYVGNVIEWGGLEHTIRALARIRQSHPASQLLIVGDGLPAYVAGLRFLVEDLGLRECVEFLGLRPPEELPGLLARGRIGLANSKPVAFRKYACPLKVMEYMAAGLPVIATQDTEAAKMLSRYECGVAIPYDVDALTGAVLRLFDHPARWQSMRDSGIRASAQLTWDNVVARELELITAQPPPEPSRFSRRP